MTLALAKKAINRSNTFSLEQRRTLRTIATELEPTVDLSGYTQDSAVVSRTERLTLPADVFTSYTSTDVVSGTGARVLNAKSFNDSAYQTAFTLITPPRDNIQTVRARFIWVPTSTSTGGVYWLWTIHKCDDQEAWDPDAFDITSFIVDNGNGTADDSHTSDWTPTADATVAGGDAWYVKAQRAGPAGADTFSGNAELRALVLEFAYNETINP